MVKDTADLVERRGSTIIVADDEIFVYVSSFFEDSIGDENSGSSRIRHS